jgi:hypothetical protein
VAGRRATVLTQLLLFKITHALASTLFNIPSTLLFPPSFILPFIFPSPLFFFQNNQNLKLPSRSNYQPPCTYMYAHLTY